MDQTVTVANLKRKEEKKIKGQEAIDIKITTTIKTKTMETIQNAAKVTRLMENGTILAIISC